MSDKKSTTYHHGDLRLALLETAIDMIAEEGLESVTLRALGQRLGVSRTAPYRHFADKSALLASVAEEGFKLLQGALESVQEERASDSRRTFQAMGSAYIQFALDNPTHYRLMFGGKVDMSDTQSELSIAGQGVFQILLRGIQACQEEGTIKAGDARTYAYVVWSGVHGISSLIIDNQINPALDSSDLAQVMLQTLMAGIAP